MMRSYPALRDGAMLAAVRAMSCSVLSSSAAVLFLPFRCRFRGVTVCAHRGTEA